MAVAPPVAILLGFAINRIDPSTRLGASRLHGLAHWIWILVSFGCVASWLVLAYDEGQLWLWFLRDDESVGVGMHGYSTSVQNFRSSGSDFSRVLFSPHDDDGGLNESFRD